MNCDDLGDDCVDRNVVAGWRLTTHERMARYQYVYGLKPIGPHRKMAGELLTPHRIACAHCDRSGILDVEGGTMWSTCPVCEGTGGSWAAVEEDVAAIRSQILKSYPDAGAPRIRFLGVPLIMAVPQNTMIDVSTIQSAKCDSDAAHVATPRAVFVLPEEDAPIERPAVRPRSAKFVATVGWWGSPASSYENVYHLSMNRSRSHWILWVYWPGMEEDFGGRMPVKPCAYCERAGIDRGAAVRLLLRTVWEGETEQGWLDASPDYILKTGLLTEAELRSLSKEVWPEDPEE